MDQGKRMIQRQRRQRRIRAKIHGSKERPRLSVFRSNRYVWAQLIDDDAGKTIAAANEREIKKEKKESRQDASAKIGGLLAKRAAERSVSQAVFDRGSYRYHGLVRSLAEGARKAGLKF